MLRRSAIPKVNRERQARRAREGRVYGPYHKAMRKLPCLLANGSCWGPIAGHHVRSVGAGGEDYANQVSLCLVHHSEVESEGRESFEARYGVDLAAVARELAEQV